MGSLMPVELVLGINNTQYRAAMRPWLDRQL